MQPTNDVPMVTHTCGAIRHIEDLGHEVDTLRSELRRCERQHSEDIRRLWAKLAVVIAAVVTVLPTGWNYLIGLI